MHRGAQSPIVLDETLMRDVIYEMTSKGLGMTCVVRDDRLLGIITDGDLRRHLGGTPNILDLRAEQIMTRDPVTVSRATLAVEALNLMERRKITSLVVVDERQAVHGVIHLHQLWPTEML
jgi:arabinose-5-phosphate isomerase